MSLILKSLYFLRWRFSEECFKVLRCCKCKWLIRRCQLWGNQLWFARFVKGHVNFIFATWGFHVLLPKSLNWALIYALYISNPLSESYTENIFKKLVISFTLPTHKIISKYEILVTKVHFSIRINLVKCYKYKETILLFFKSL